jgi:hypothetical protein
LDGLRHASRSWHLMGMASHHAVILFDADASVSSHHEGCLLLEGHCLEDLVDLGGLQFHLRCCCHHAQYPKRYCGQKGFSHIFIDLALI